MAHRVVYIALLLSLLILLRDLQARTRGKNAAVAVLGNGLCTSNSAADLAAVMPPLTSGTPFEGKWQINKPPNDQYINLYVLSRNSRGAFPGARRLYGNVTFVGYPQVIVVDDTYVESFLKRLVMAPGVSITTRGSASWPAYIRTTYRRPVLLWLVGHEVGHVVGGHKPREPLPGILGLSRKAVSRSHYGELQADRFCAVQAAMDTTSKRQLLQLLSFYDRNITVPLAKDLRSLVAGLDSAGCEKLLRSLGELRAVIVMFREFFTPTHPMYIRRSLAIRQILDPDPTRRKKMLRRLEAAQDADRYVPEIVAFAAFAESFIDFYPSRNAWGLIHYLVLAFVVIGGLIAWVQPDHNADGSSMLAKEAHWMLFYVWISIPIAVGLLCPLSDLWHILFLPGIHCVLFFAGGILYLAVTWRRPMGGLLLCCYTHLGIQGGIVLMAMRVLLLLFGSKCPMLARYSLAINTIFAYCIVALAQFLLLFWLVPPETRGEGPSRILRLSLVTQVLLVLVLPVAQGASWWRYAPFGVPFAAGVLFWVLYLTYSPRIRPIRHTSVGVHADVPPTR